MNFVTLKIQLLRTDISRTIVVPEDWSIEKLSTAIQAAFGWEGFHLWSFQDETGQEIGLPDMLADDFSAVVARKPKSARRAKVRDYFPKKGAKLDYEYDFGDGWLHRVTRMVDSKISEVACVKTTGVMGIEDIGGPGRLNALLKALREFEANPEKELEEWLKEVFDWAGCDNAENRHAILEEPAPVRITELIRNAVTHRAL